MAKKVPVKKAEPAANLRQRIIRAASEIFVSEGYDHLSMRRVAELAGCSQMAAYRHFANKEALTQHLCAQLYTDFTQQMFARMDAAEDPMKKLRIFIASLLEFAQTYPDHYSIVFLVRHSDPEVVEEREALGQRFLGAIHSLIREILPKGTSAAISATRMRQVVTAVHGTAALLIAHPRAYGLTPQRVVKDTEEAVERILG
ncbi:TetR/AcrR family transcriptional regulator [Granulicella cerasi]|uniref:TetR/AcrR family transcriptional regulator n=1 Tax=Granulicella cerasi TaxID=741063 RepID=A0ABW1ZB62_9BACT|nr:TetR/AcrR family transcriptional regulator [Granulicella cerasi]